MLPLREREADYQPVVWHQPAGQVKKLPGCQRGASGPLLQAVFVDPRLKAY